MRVFTQEITINSQGNFDVINITEQVRDVLHSSDITEGGALVYYKHTTGAVLLVEHEAGMIVDLEDMLERVAPENWDYKHHLRGYDANGAAHIRTALLQVSLTIPVVDGDLALGNYQEILMLDMDPGEKLRTVLVQISGV